MTAASPGIVASAMENRHYPSMEEYVAGRRRCASIRVPAPSSSTGLLLQIDAPDLALERHTLFADRPLADFLAWVELVVGAINAALSGIDPGRVRLHVCWGNYEGPHTLDVALEEILPLLYQAHGGWRSWCRWPIPATPTSTGASSASPCPHDMVLVAGVIDTTSNYVEHPEVVADRLVRVAEAVGDPRRVIAGTDCGFDTSAGIGDIAPSVVWEKLRALRAGADLATTRLWPASA